MEVDHHPRLVAECQKARCGHEKRHRIADNDIARAVAHLVLRPGHGHHPERAVEGGQVERDRRAAIGPCRDNAREERYRLLDGRRPDLDGGPGPVTARAQAAALGPHAVNKPAVEIANLGGEPAAAIEPFLRRGRRKAGHGEDAHIDRGDNEMRLLARLEPGETDRDIEARGRLDLFRQIERNTDRARRLVDTKPGEAYGAAGHLLGLDIHGAVEEGRDIGAGAPVLVHREGNRRAARRNLDLALPGKAIAKHHHERPAGHLGLDCEPRCLAWAIAFLVEGHLEDLRRIGALAAIPARGKADTACRPRRLA